MLCRQEIVFPARAGMILPQGLPSLSMRRIPRESGDDPALSIREPCTTVYSPRERG